MPTYVYGCDLCGHEFELFQRMTDAPIRECPSCNEDSAHRKLTASSFILKGGGWYADGYSSARQGSKTAKGTSPPPG